MRWVKPQLPKKEWQRLAVPQAESPAKRASDIGLLKCKNAELGIAGKSAEAPQGPQSERAATPSPIQSRYSLEPKWLEPKWLRWL